MHYVDRRAPSSGVPARPGRLARLAGVAAAALALAVVAAPGGIAAASNVVECGQVVAYVAPDPVGPADGSLTIGQLPAWTIAPDATVSAAVATALPSFAGTGPSCFDLELDDSNVIVGLDFAGTGSISGQVVEDSGVGGYVFDERLIVPTFITDAYPGLAAVFVTSAAAGTPASATFTVDTTTGQFTGVEASAVFCGAGGVNGDGDGLVGNAVIPADVLDAGDVATLASADGNDVCASVHVVGTIGAELDIVTDVSITIDAPAATPIASPPDTSATASTEIEDEDPAPGPMLLGTVALVLVLLRAGRRGMVRRTS